MTALIDLVFGGNETFFFLILTGLAAAVMLGGILWIFAAANEKRRMERRLSSIKNRATGGGGASATAAATVRRMTADSSVVVLDQLIKQILPNRKQLRSRLMRTGRKFTIGDYLIASTVLGLVSAALVVFVFGASIFLAVCAFLVAGVGVPYWVIGYMGHRRRKQFVAQFPEGIDMIVRGIKSGIPVTEAMGIVGSEMAAPIGEEFSLMADGIRFGKSLEEAMWDAADRIKAPEYDFFVVALSVQKETGGNLAETLENLSDVLRSRSQMKKKVKAMASEPKASAMILGSLPFVMFVIIFMMNPDYIMTLFEDPRGKYIIGIGLLSETLGVAIMVKLVNFEI